MKIDQVSMNQIFDCIQELTRITVALNHAADEVEKSIKGVSTWKYTNGLRSSAEKYDKARRKLQSVR